ncbi:MAG: protoporphyrinogen/coproporphyrinogen oxidase [Actinomycetota bacterium]|nr:protoporphyrinogen/coproporphyrinogen oxidase [Actinomycetota bacterium]
MTDFVIVGGGVGGLVLARRLVLGGADVIVLEASDRLGGSVASHTVGGIQLDAGAESFATRRGTVATLARSLKLGDDIVEPNPVGAWLQPATGPAFRLPLNSMLGIPGSPLAADVTPIIGGRAATRAYLETLLPGLYAAKSKTLGELVRRRMGEAVLDQLVRPIVRGVHSADPDDLDLDKVAPGLRAAMIDTGSLARAVRSLQESSGRAGSSVAGIRGGIFRIVEALVADLDRFGVDVRLNSRVENVADGRALVGVEGGSSGTHIQGRAIVAAPGILGDVSNRGHRVVLATLVVDQPLLDAAPRGTGLLVAKDGSGIPTDGGIRAKALTHVTAKWEWVAERAEGKHVLRLSYDDDSADLAEVARADAEALLGVPIPTSSVLAFGRSEWYRPPRLTHTPDGIHVVGETIAGTGLANVVGQADELAGNLLRDS